MPIYRIVGHVFALVSGTAAAAAIGFVTQLSLARSLSLESYGRLSAILTATNFLAAFAGCGMGLLWLQLFGSEGWAALRWIPACLKLVAATSVSAVALTVGYVFFFQPATSSTTILIAMMTIPVVIGQGLTEATAARLQLEERYSLLSAWQMFTPLGRALIAALAILSGNATILVVLGGISIVGATSALISIVSANQVRHGHLQLKGHGPANDNPGISPTTRRVLRDAVPYFLFTMFYLGYSQITVALVDANLGSADAAIYNVAFLIVSAVQILPSVVYSKYLVGKIFRWWVQDRPIFDAVLHLGVVVQTTLGLLAMALLLLAAPLIVPLIFGARFGPAIPILMVLSLTIPFRFVSHVYSSAFYSREHLPRKVFYMGQAAAINLILNLALTPTFGLMGAVVAVLVAEFSLVVLFMYGIARHVGSIDLWSSFRLSTLRNSIAYLESRRRV